MRLWSSGRQRRYLVFTRQTVHFYELVMVVEYQLDACQQVVSWFLVFQTVSLPMVFPQILQSLQRQMNNNEVE